MICSYSNCTCVAKCKFKSCKVMKVFVCVAMATVFPYQQIITCISSVPRDICNKCQVHTPSTVIETCHMGHEVGHGTWARVSVVTLSVSIGNEFSPVTTLMYTNSNSSKLN